MNLKVSVLLNRITADYKDDFEKARVYYKEHGIDITWDFKNIDVRGYISSYDSLRKRYLLTGTPSLVITDPTADITMFCFDESEWATPLGSPFPLKPDVPAGHCYLSNGKPFIDAPTYLYDHNNNIQWILIAHELLHALTILANNKGIPTPDILDSYFHNDDPNYPNGNFAQQWKLLEPFLTQSMYKYFKPNEVIGLKPELVSKLDQARGIASVPFIITSGFRTQAQNKAVGGVSDSAHTTGEAVDLSCKDSVTRFKIISALLQVGFNRIEDCQKHIHADISKTLPQNVFIWSNDD